MVNGQLQREIEPCIQSSYFANTGITSCKINVHRLYGDIFDYDEFKTALNTILLDAGVEDYVITRLDVRLDSYDREHYKKYAKLNRLITSMLAITYHVNNKYRYTDLITHEQLSIAAKNDRFQIEFYDNRLESREKDLAESRLELRSLKWNVEPKNIREKFVNEWNTRLDKAIEKYERMQLCCNDELEKVYLRDKDSFPKKFSNLTNFLLQYQECIFTKEQMIDLLERFPEVKNAVNKEKNHRSKYGIDYYTIDDVKDAIGILKTSVEDYFYK